MKVYCVYDIHSDNLIHCFSTLKKAKDGLLFLYREFYECMQPTLYLMDPTEAQKKINKEESIPNFGYIKEVEIDSYN